MKNGFSVLEVILAAAIFMIFSIAAVATIVQSYNANRLGLENSLASQFAAGGIEGVRSIKNRDFTNLANFNSVGIQRNNPGNFWEFKAEGTNNTLEKYTRVIKVESVNRDGDGNIVLSGGTLDPDTKKVTSTVTWNFNTARPETTSLITYLSDWRKPIVNGGPVMMAYSKTTSTPYYRIWDGANWSAEASAQNVGGNINYIVLKSSRTRNEAILGTLDSGGNIYAQVWNGAAWSTPTLMANVGATLAAYRGFDLDYEKNGDRAIIVYQTNSTSADPSYRIWDGTSWSGAVTITAPPTTSTIRWIEAEQNPLPASQEIAMILLDGNTDVYGLVWNGTAWNNMGTSSVWDATASVNTKKAIDVAYEQLSGRAMFAWGDSVATDQYYRIWNGTSLTGPTLLDITTQGGVAHWVQLASRPNSNDLMYGSVDAGADLNTRKWSGSAWDSATEHPEHSAGVENITSRAFDIVWETHSANPGKAWLLWGNRTRVSAKQWSGSAWDNTVNLPGSDDTSFIRLKTDFSSGAVLAGIYESAASATDDIWESRLTGGGTSWNSKNTIWTGPVSSEPTYFRIDIASP